MPAIGAMPGAYPWTSLVVFQKDMTSKFSDETENQTIIVIIMVTFPTVIKTVTS